MASGRMPGSLLRESPLVGRVVAPNPGPFTGPGTNTYLVGAGGHCAVVDPGPDDQAHVDHIVTAAEELRARIDLILVTHSHRDHLPGARLLRDRIGAPLAAAGDITRVERPLHHGQRIPLAGCWAEAIYTPGHARDHYCFLLQPEGSLFSGDLILGQGTVLIAPPGGDMDEYLTSLRALRQYGIRRIMPGHWDPVEDPDAKISEYINHRLEREGQVLANLRDGVRTVPAMVDHMYEGLDPRLRAAAESQVTAHLISLERRGVVRAREGNETHSYELI